MKKSPLGLFLFLSFCALGSKAQNLLNLTDWVVGTGGITGLAQNGLTSENQREWGTGAIRYTGGALEGKPEWR